LRAKAVCESCPVRAECLNHAVRAGERYGVWGGLTSDERLAWRQTA
jgi:WhiB family redox-sensing transcriptional regulator